MASSGLDGDTELRDHLVEAIATIEPLTRVWVLLSEWNDAVGQWSVTAFRDLNVAHMRTQVYAFLATATELTKLASNSREGARPLFQEQLSASPPTQFLGPQHRTFL